MTQNMIQIALKASHKAYAPYSKFRVGASILTEKGGLFAGFNVENASYSLTICAERSAIVQAIHSEGIKYFQISKVVVVNTEEKIIPPCGACRQMIHEFGEMAEILITDGKEYKFKPLSLLLPDVFSL
ncbi:MAG: cytidine deaminase [bacterium]|nr:cytidine deaminase [bacterium]